MKKKKWIFQTFLVVIILASAYTTYRLMGSLENLDNLVYIPIALLLIALSIWISTIVNTKNRRMGETNENRLKMWNSITYKVKKAGETAFNELPIGIVVIDNNYQIVWSNNRARSIFMSPLEHINIKTLTINLYDEIQKNMMKNDKIIFKSDIYGEIYNIEYLPSYNVIYFTQITDHENLKEKYEMRTVAIGYINVDNYEESLADFDVQERAEYQGKIIGAIAKWADGFQAYVRAYSDSRYMIITDYEQLQKMQKSNFDILDDIKVLLRTTTVIRITLSIGIACRDININQLANEAQEQLEMALSRGGDQVVVKINNHINFFGAKTDPVQKESKVEIRNKSQELQDLFKSSHKIFAIGHRNLDADGFAATVAIYRLAKTMGKEAYIILEPTSIDGTVMKILDTIKLEYITLLNDIVTPSKVSNMVTNNSLLMIVDCQTEQQLADSKFVKKFNNIGIIDHHRKGTGSIQNPKFYYTQTAASSTVELIFELLTFYEEPIEYRELEATWMLLGMVVDTNNFVYRTSAITFEVASILKRYGADMSLVKKYLKEDYTDKIARNAFLKNMQLITENIAIAYSSDDIIYDRVTLAKVSDELISVVGVELGITIGYISENEIGLSARSLGSFNCQTIMEKMGGGGHLNNAAAQIKDSTIPDVIGILKEKINTILLEEANMKIILTKDVKGKGKKGDIAEVPAGYGNFLIQSGSAIIASVENIKAFEREKEEEKLRIEKTINDAKEMKKVIESQPIKIQVKVGQDGKLFGSVNTKQIGDVIESTFNIKVDRRKIQLNNSLTTLGVHEVGIQLYKDVNAVIKVFLVESEKQK